MAVQESMQLFGALSFLVIGLSHVVEPRTWAEFFIGLRVQGKRGVFAVAFMALPFGLLVAAFHNVWSGLPMLLTIVGWCQVIKGATYFIVPSVGLRGLSLVSVEKAGRFVIPGLVFILLGVALLVDLIIKP